MDKRVIVKHYTNNRPFRTEGTEVWTSDNEEFLCVRNMLGFVEHWPMRQMVWFSVQ